MIWSSQKTCKIATSIVLGSTSEICFRMETHLHRFNAEDASNSNIILQGRCDYGSTFAQIYYCRR